MYANVTAIKSKGVHYAVVNNEKLKGKFGVFGLQDQPVTQILNVFGKYRVVNDRCLAAHLPHNGIANQHFFIQSKDL